MKKFKVIYHVGKETVTGRVNAEDIDGAVVDVALAGLKDFSRVNREPEYAILIPYHAITAVTVEEEPEE